MKVKILITTVISNINDITRYLQGNNLLLNGNYMNVLLLVINISGVFFLFISNKHLFIDELIFKAES